ncbi:MAG TPA: hypothetical protein VMP12_02610, partial [Candidatus Sulfotelmatobacter sp.]|nr:hypothetical protein [Candidatus Sulfotelmatobacter sp.]
MDIHLLLLDEVEQEVEGALVGRDRDFVRGGHFSDRCLDAAIGERRVDLLEDRAGIVRFAQDDKSREMGRKSLGQRSLTRKRSLAP